MLEAEAKERMKAGGGMHTGNQHTGIKMEGVSTLRQAADSSRQPTSVRIAASAIGVSNGNISEMKRITNVAPERAEEIKQGKTSIPETKTIRSDGGGIIRLKGRLFYSIMTS